MKRNNNNDYNAMQMTVNQLVTGSSPVAAANFK